ncbi:MAG: hypothetical protein P4N60_06720 [Verrucomicrobiae bacterium]|nr:hypothetical protein [Verrucomicrobiae bacterium]
MNTPFKRYWAALFTASATFGVAAIGMAQVNTGSNGSDGAFNPAANTVINMADHPNGIYQYTSVTIPNGVTVMFIPNANNSPVTWLVQSNCEIDGTVDVSGKTAMSSIGGAGGPGGWAGGNGGGNQTLGQGPGAGYFNTGGSYGTLAQSTYGTPGEIYGNPFLLPLLGGSGGSGGSGVLGNAGGGGGGGAILVAVSGSFVLNGQISADAGNGGTGGSGGGIRLVALNFSGTGNLLARAGSSGGGGGGGANGGLGRIRIDAFQNTFGGYPYGSLSQGFQPIIIPVAGQGVQLSIASVAGTTVSAAPNGQIVSPDAIISGQQANPIPIMVNCANLPLNTLITVTVKPASGASISAVGHNTTGTLAASTATVSLTMPRGGGIIYATAATSN